MAKISVLYAREKSIYKELEIDVWDIKRDANKWPGGNPIIAHPPCRAWGDYSHKAKPRPGEKELAVKAIHKIRMWGGVMEHPRKSKIWQEMQIKEGGKPDHWGGWTLNIDQYWFGHRAKKNTTLYIVGIKPAEIPTYPIKLGKPIKTIEEMGKAERERTPKKLAIWLVKLAKQIQHNYDNTKMD